MQLYYSVASPYARKVRVMAIELGLDAEIEKIPITVSPLERHDSLAVYNPLMKVPTLITDYGESLYDSPVICEYLAGKAPSQLLPAGQSRWAVLRAQALCDGILDAALLCFFESRTRREEYRSAEWVRGHSWKAVQGLDALQRELTGLACQVTLAHIAAACTIGWMELRDVMGDIRTDRPDLFAWYDTFIERPSMQATMPV